MDRFEIFLSELDGINQHIPPSDFVLEVRISLKHRYVYVASSKCACTTIKAMLIRMELDDRDHKFHDFKDIHEQRYSPLLNPMQVGNFAKILQDKSFVKFCFVRNPYDRLLSAYLDKIVKDTWHRRAFYSSIGLGKDEKRAITFENFVKAIAAQPIDKMDRHWRIQYHQTMQNRFPYDIVGRVESLQDDIAKIGVAIGRNPLDFYDGVSLNRSDASDGLARHYTPELRDIVYDTYRIDFEHFGYDRKPPCDAAIIE